MTYLSVEGRGSVLELIAKWKLVCFAAVTVAAAALIGVLYFLLLDVGTKDEAISSYFIDVEVTHDGESGPGPYLTRMEGWYDRGKVRWNLYYDSQDSGEVRSYLIADGDGLHWYDATQDSYSSEPQSEDDSFAFFRLGKLACSLDCFIDGLPAADNYQSHEILGSAELLDRQVAILEVMRLVDSPGGPTRIQQRYWIDEATSLVLAYEFGSANQFTRYVATTLEVNPGRASPGTFAFVPPEGAKEIPFPAKQPPVTP